MIRYKAGNLFSDEGNSLAHCVSADFKMGAGIAKEFNKKWGAEIFTAADEMPDVFSGMCIVAKIENRFIFNLITKNYYWNKPTLNSLEIALKEMFNLAKNTYNVRTIAMPKIGCGLDRLKWNDVSKLIMKHQGEISVIVYTGEKGK